MVTELRENLNVFSEETYNDGYRAGVRDEAAHNSPDSTTTFLRGEAKGMVWAYHAAKGAQVTEPDNPFVSKKIVDGLMNIK